MSVQAATKAIFFLGTPHRGSNMAPLGETIRKIVAITGVDTNSKNIRALHFDSTELEISREEFMRKWRQGSFIVRTFQEGQGFKGYFGINGKVTLTRLIPMLFLKLTLFQLSRWLWICRLPWTTPESTLNI
ncbi:hypothetical protein ACMFMG_006392 [Clarireedia jacksonii]